MKTSNGKLMRAADSFVFFSALGFLMRFVCSTVMNEKCLVKQKLLVMKKKNNPRNVLRSLIDNAVIQIEE